MTKNILKIIVVLTLAGATVGCSAYAKLMKDGDADTKYRTAMEYYEQGKYDKAIQLFESVTVDYSGSMREDTLAFTLGSAYYRSGNFEMSEYLFDDFRSRFRLSPFLEEAEYMYAMGFYYSSPSPDRDQSVTNKAIFSIHEYLDRYPESIKKQLCLVRIDELRGKLFDKAFINANTYYKIGRYKSAVIAFRNALAQYPETPHREEILYLTTAAAYELAYNSIETLQRDRYLDMVDAYYSFVAEFPDSKRRRELDRMHNVARNYLAGHSTDAPLEAVEEQAAETAAAP